MLKFISRLSPPDRVQFGIAVVLAVSGLTSVYYGQASIRGGTKFWRNDTSFSGDNAAIFGFLLLAGAYCAARSLFGFGWPPDWSRESRILALVFIAGAVAYVLGAAS